MGRAPTPADWKLRAAGTSAVLVPYLGIIVRLVTASPLKIAISGLALWLYGAASVGFIVAHLSEKPSVSGRILLWTFIPFVPAYLATVLVTGILLTR